MKSGAMGLLLACGLALSACQSSGGVKTKADSPSTSSAKHANTSATVRPATSKPTATVAHVGATITLGGNEKPGEKLAVTVVKVAATTKATDGFTKPSRGMRFAAVQFRLRNVGKSTYSDSPDNDSKVFDRQGQSFGSYITGGNVKAGPGFANGTVNIAPGGAELGYLTFQVPRNFKIAKVQFGTDSGFGETAEWINP